MIGSKKLTTIRRELQRMLNATEDDPINWVEKRINAVEQQVPAAFGEADVLRSLQRFVESSMRKSSRKRGSTSRK
jgi:hypothetical protein